MVGRETEKEHLKSLLKSKEHEFVAVFGRRRVGKTYLIRESYEYNFVFQHTGINNNLLKDESMIRHQLDKFAESLYTYGVKTEQPIKDWDEAFYHLRKVIEQSKEKKKVIFIDELSWMDTKGSRLLSALESFWNGWVTARKEKDVILIVCTSATYWMIDKIVNSKGGLHNRLT
ncbi:MAG: ATP-binding protein, partial [Lachnospiraceae bacterium]|nr:ATP-binding protein [Candidatus Colinaster scatohippi]